MVVGNLDGINVIVDSDGQLGTSNSSRRFKKDIKPMDQTSEVILALKPVTFHYKNADTKKAQTLAVKFELMIRYVVCCGRVAEVNTALLAPSGAASLNSAPRCGQCMLMSLLRTPDENTPQFGLIAEDVAEVNSDLVARDADGQPLTVRYDAVNAMLLNEFLKEHKKVEEQQTNITQLNAKMANQAALIAQQQKGMELLTAQLKEQAAQIQKVSAQLEVNKPAQQVVSHKQ